MRISEILKTLGIPVAYGSFREAVKPPFLVYLGAGQNAFEADNTFYQKTNKYRIEYYFKIKDEEQEDRIETVLLSHFNNYEKSDDTYIESDAMYVIYYDV